MATKQTAKPTAQAAGKSAKPTGLVQVKKQSTAIEAVPDHLKNRVGDRSGTEGMSRNDMLMPRLGQAQTLSPQMKERKPEYIDGLEIGEFFNTATGEIYGKSVKVVFLFFFKQRIYFEDVSKGGGIICISANAIDGGRLHPSDCATCEHAQFIDGEAPDCGMFFNYMSALVREDGTFEPIVVTFKSTGLKDAKKINSMVRMSNLPMYAKYYQIDSINKVKGDQDWEAMDVKPLSYVEPKLFAQCEEMFNALRDKAIEVDTRGLTEEDTSFDTQGM